MNEENTFRLFFFPAILAIALCFFMAVGTAYGLQSRALLFGNLITAIATLSCMILVEVIRLLRPGRTRSGSTETSRSRPTR